MHLAAESHVDRSIDGPAAFIDTNITGTYTLLEAARAYWGGTPRLPLPPHLDRRGLRHARGRRALFTEETPYAPNSPYSASKAASDHLVRAWHETYGLPVVLSNCSNNYGPFHFPEKLIPVVILNALAAKPIPVYGRGENVRDWLFVEDHATALLAVAAARRASARATTSAATPRRETSTSSPRICALMDEMHPEGAPHAELITYVTDRPGHDFRYAIDASKIRRELGWQPSVTLDEGLRRTVRWYLDNRDWWQAIQARGHTLERLGLKTAQG